LVLTSKPRNRRGDFEAQIIKSTLLVLRPKQKTQTTGFEAKPGETVATDFKAKPEKTVPMILRPNH
jgi:hypothetical protein